MIDHLALGVRDMEKSRAFYDQALRPLGYRLLRDFDTGAAFGVEGKPDFWIHGDRPPITSLHVAFAATDRATVRAFHDAALAAGGRDNGAPGLRPHYHENYYGAFVFDPDGNNVEAVCHWPE